MSYHRGPPSLFLYARSLGILTQAFWRPLGMIKYTYICLNIVMRMRVVLLVLFSYLTKLSIPSRYGSPTASTSRQPLFVCQQAESESRYYVARVFILLVLYVMYSGFGAYCMCCPYCISQLTLAVAVFRSFDAARGCFQLIINSLVAK